jgi:hypothetical protein
MSTGTLKRPAVWLRSVGMIALLVACAAAAPAGANKDLQALRESPRREEVATAAVRIAGSDDPGALRELGRLLASRPFLARLDDLDAPQAATFNVRRVFLALAARPSQSTEAVCLQAATSTDFIDDPARTRYALEALAAVQPMSPGGEALFRRMNEQGFFAFDGPLLAANGSDRAVSVLESMLADRSQSVVERVALAREAIVPNRIKRSVVDMVDRLRKHGIETELLLALAECIFEYRPDEWYGKRRNPPQAPSWSAATQEARQAVIALGRRLLERNDLSASLRAATEAFTKP